MQAIVDKNICVGCRLCTKTCPDVFHMDSDGKSVAIDSEIPESQISNAQEARDGCPVSAISLS